MGQEKKQPASTRAAGDCLAHFLEVDHQAALEFRLVDTPSALESFAVHAGRAEMVAVDLEADSMYHYREKVCLVQMAANGETVVIDPLKVPDLSPLKPLFADGHLLKVFHGADYDVRSLYRDFGISINNLFDTQLACMFLGHPGTSLESVVARNFGVELDKKYQKKDWSQRPLPEGMVAYAAADVIYLIPLARALIAELDVKGRLTWVREGCAGLSRVRSPEANGDPMFLRFRGAGRLAPRQLAALEELLQVRDALAQQKDRPLFKVLSNTVVLKLAMTMPLTMEELKSSRVLTHKQLNMYGPALVSALEKAHKLTADQWPAYPRRKSPRLSQRIPVRVNALREWRDQMAGRLGLDPGLLLNKALILDLARLKPADSGALERTPNIHRWQVAAFGDQILKIVNQYP